MSPVANGAAASPRAATGFPPAGHPFAGAMCMVGISRCTGSGNCGEGPVPAENGRRAVSPHAMQSTPARAARKDLVIGFSARLARERDAARELQVLVVDHAGLERPARAGHEVEA